MRCNRSVLVALLVGSYFILQVASVSGNSWDCQQVSGSVTICCLDDEFNPQARMVVENWAPDTCEVSQGAIQGYVDSACWECFDDSDAEEGATCSGDDPFEFAGYCSYDPQR